MAMQKILIVDDDTNISQLISLYLVRERFETQTAEDGETALRVYEEFQPDLVLLDLMLPGIDGYHVCREIRKTSQTPIIMMSAKGEVFDKVLGLELGADDYVTKPFDSKELVARIKAVLRRSAPRAEAAAPAAGGHVISLPGLVINHQNYSVTLDGEELSMTPKELDLLYFLASQPGKVFTRDQLLMQLWGYDYDGDNRTVDVHIKRLREKLGESPAWALQTVWGVGYKFEIK